MKRFILATVVVCAFWGGCERLPPYLRRDEPVGLQDDVPPLAIQQARVYPETVTGFFVSLADFEDAPVGPPGHRQIDNFTVASGGQRKFVVNITRTGSGAMQVTLPPKGRLVFSIPDVRDFTGYTLLSMAIYSESLRDDLYVRLTGAGGEWRSHRMLIRPGWNTVLIDIQRLKKPPAGPDNNAAYSFDVTDVRALDIGFADAAGDVTFWLDDIMLINNRRWIKPTPPGVVVQKAGLDYTLTLPGLSEPLVISQGLDGLWRLGEHQALMRLAAPGRQPAGSGEQLALMGPRRVGQVKVLEHNAVRLRLANTWYFPGRAGEWTSLAVRRICWEYSFYGDGRWVTHVELNNSGGSRIGQVSISLNRPAAWANGKVSATFTVRDFHGPVGRWSYMLAPSGLRQQALQRDYLAPGRLVRTLVAAADNSGSAGGDIDRDGFDESQGCYFLRAVSGNCRFTLVPPGGGLLRPVFRVAGNWQGEVSVSSGGLAIRNVARLADGSALFVLPGWLRDRTPVEVVGRSAMPVGP